MKKIILWLLCIIIVTFVGYYSTDRSKLDNTSNTITTETVVQSSNINNEWYYLPSDAVILEALKEGHGYSYNALGMFEKKYSLPQIENSLVSMKDDPPQVFLRTPYFEMVEKSYKSKETIEPIDLESTKIMNVTNSGFVLASFFIYGDRPDYITSFTAELKQGDTTIPAAIKKMKGIDSEPIKASSTYGGKDRYYLEVMNIFLAGDEIDLSKTAELILNFQPNDGLISYKVNFKIYK